MIKNKYLLTIFILLISLSINAEIITDGSIGSRANLSGPDYLIGADLGHQMGGNLFHSFQDFNLNSLESATFSGPNSVQNILSRVTGGNPSNIDGLIRSTIPNADMYFLNPNGIIFGPNARLDLQGSFHTSTADYLRLGENGRFDATNPNNSSLTVAPVEAFGFLDETIGSISLEGQETIYPTYLKDEPIGLRVPDGKTFSMIGGNINISHGFYSAKELALGTRVAIDVGTIVAKDGRINLASVASAGEVIPTISDLEVSTFDNLGKITISDNSFVQTNGSGKGAIFIRGGQLMVTSSHIFALNLINQDNNQLATPGNDKNRVGIDVKVGEISLKDNAFFSTTTRSSGNASDISIVTNKLFLDNFSLISSDTYGIRDAGNVFINTHDLSLNNGSFIASITYHAGNAKNVDIDATGTVSISGVEEGGWVGAITSTAFNISSSDTRGGNAGTVFLKAGELRVKNGGQISSSTIAPDGMQSGLGGNIKIQVSGAINLSGVNPHGENEDGFGGGIYARTQGYDTGDAGEISIEAESLSITEGAVISSSTSSNAKGGNINIHIDDSLTLSGSFTGLLKESLESQIDFQEQFSNSSSKNAVSSILTASLRETDNTGQAGNILIKANKITLTEGAQINSATLGGGQGGSIALTTDTLTISEKDKNGSQSGIFSHSENLEAYAGSAGIISIQAPTIKLTNGGIISTKAQNAGGGHISLATSNLLYLRKGQLTTSVKGGIGKGGNISIGNPQFTILDRGQITAQANAGHGGNIRIVAEQFIKSPESLISASSKLGLDGSVHIDSPTVDMNALMVILQEKFAKAQLKQCTNEEIENPSTFKVNLIREKSLPFGNIIESSGDIKK
ncbi:filamentous hemagglutinin N-terminal domain-containing protein [Candidatus Parabeggiatoa sp. HSG14]|uniref:two-partner secretion domain-containing protein n=1 Tax=Candidatus Parabeggiatoa sp. HSG14 TaxID=3055593 RepID=UPI0025A6937D|nr:filamentous hemagglutinin N-terminal domain-containing protein [Thiotrichales bacterium HSG14]